MQPKAQSFRRKKEDLNIKSWLSFGLKPIEPFQYVVLTIRGGMLWGPKGLLVYVLFSVFPPGSAPPGLSINLASTKCLLTTFQ